MTPVPAVASPPERDQMTGAALPLVSLAENRCTERPRGSVALHPVQLVSMAATPGEMANVALVGLVVAVAVPQPDNMKTAGAVSREPARSRTPRRRVIGDGGVEIR